jgi:hypothetical protein
MQIDLKKIVLVAVVVIAVVATIVVGATYLRPGQPSESDLGFETISKGVFCGYTHEAYLVVRNENEWVNLWNKVKSVQATEPPEVDFSSYMVIAVFMGQKPTGGHSIEIVKVVEGAGKVTVNVVKNYPPPGTAVPQVLTQPYHIVKVRRTEKAVVFKVVANFE